jgi:pimeloyl-ACP methyl ester carboxylesterase
MNVMFGQTFMRDADRAVERETWRQLIGSQSLAGGLHAVDGVLERSGVHRDLAKITAPTLIIVGNEDAAAPLRLGKRINDAIAGSQLVTVPAGHTSPVEQPDAVTAAIEEFLATNRMTPVVALGLRGRRPRRDHPCRRASTAIRMPRRSGDGLS